MPRGATTAMVLLVLAGAAIPAGCQAPLPPEPTPPPQLVLWDRTWDYMGHAGQQVRTPHYHIFTTINDPEFLERMPQFLETAFLHYRRMIPATKTPDGPMEVYLFGRRDQWDRFTDESTGASAAIYRRIQEGGYVDNGRAVFYDIQRLKTFAVTGHEGFHQYIWHYARHRPPAWLDEGLACYFEGFVWQGEQLRFQPRQNPLRLRALRFAMTGQTLGLEELLSTHPGIIIGGPPQKVASYYAQLWALALFLQDEHAERFQTLLDDVGAERMVRRAAAAGYAGRTADYGPAVFRAYINPDLADAQRRFGAYCIRLAGF